MSSFVKVSLKEENEEELTKTRINKTEYFEELYQVRTHYTHILKRFYYILLMI